MEHSLFEQLLVLLIGAVVATTLFRRIQLPPILAYIAVGAVAGPFALGIADPHDLELMSELGVVFLLFMLGLEFSLAKMIAMRKVVFGLGSLQVGITAVILFVTALLMGTDSKSAIVISGALALSSTAIVIRELIRVHQLGSAHGQIAFGILLFQDLAAVAFLIVVPLLGSHSSEVDSSTLVVSLLQGAGLLAVLLLLGRTVLPALFHEIGRSRSDELFVLVALVTALAAAWLTHAAGLSMALGGFIAGMMLGESHYKHQLEADIRPFRDVLLGLFFVAVGMQLNLGVLLENWYWVVLFTLTLLVLKTVLITVLATRLNGDKRVSLKAGLALAQGGEFGFALLALALNHEVVSSEVNALVIATIILSMIATPVLIGFNDRIVTLILGKPKSDQAVHQEMNIESLEAATDDLDNHVIICGFGRVGQIVARFLKPLNLPYIAIDADPVRSHEAAQAGEPAYYGNAHRVDILRALGAERARLLILTIPDHTGSLTALRAIKRNFPNLQVLVRTQDDSQLNTYQEAGATEVIPEALEGSLMLVSHILTMLNVPEDEINTSINEVRSQRYQMLHGFLHGERSKKHTDEGAPNILRHAITLPEGAACCGRGIDVMSDKITLIAVRRDEQEIPLEQVAAFSAGDVLVLEGIAEQIEAAEARLLHG